jgi:putative transposase
MTTTIIKDAYSAAELAALKVPGWPATEYRMRARLARERVATREVSCRGGRGGMRREYLTAGLPLPIRQWLAEQQIKQAAPAVVLPPPAAVAPTRAVAAGDLSEWQIEVGSARAWVLDEVSRAAETTSMRRAARLFVTAARAGELLPEATEMVRIANARRGANGRMISVAALTRWRQRARGAATPAERIRRLAPRSRGVKWAMDADVIAALALYRQPNKPSLNWCVKETARKLDVPYGSLYGRSRRALGKVPAPAFYPVRNRGAALRAMLPFRRREFQSMLPNDVWIGDGHSAKLKIAHPETGKPFVPEVTVVMDVQSRYVVGWSVALSENCLAVSDALRHGIARHGTPLIYYSDGGAGQTARMLDAPLTGILPAMGIEHRTGRPGHPQARGVIERFWPTVLIPLARRFATYQGRGHDRETLRQVITEIDRQLREASRGEVVALPSKLPTFQQFLDALDQEIETYNATHRHTSLPKLDGVNHATPAEYRTARLGEADIYVPSEQDVATLFMPSVVRVARRGEVRLWNGVYFHRDLMLVDGERVQVGYDIHDASRVLVKKITGEPIAWASLDGNRDGWQPKALIEQLREQRAGRRMARLEEKMADVRAELRGAMPAAPALDPIEIAPEPEPDNVVALAPGARPQFFGDTGDIEKYRWLLAHEGLITDEDRAWIAWYRTTSEWADIFGDEPRREAESY